jgi:hypothetical protein
MSKSKNCCNIVLKLDSNFEVNTASKESIGLYEESNLNSVPLAAKNQRFFIQIKSSEKNSHTKFFNKFI